MHLNDPTINPQVVTTVNTFDGVGRLTVNIGNCCANFTTLPAVRAINQN